MLGFLTKLDRLIVEVDALLRTVVNPAVGLSERSSPGVNDDSDMTLDTKSKAHSGACMRVNHTGEVCAQALYRGQAFVAKDQKTQSHLYHAAEEEYDHLAWCEQRLEELDTHKSYLNLFWYTNSFLIGASAGMISDALSYGFVIETERQVMVHLKAHLESISENDVKSRAILDQMYTDEAEHAKAAKAAGGVELPLWAKILMKGQSKIMTTLAYHI